jgi:hypothetical protein
LLLAVFYHPLHHLQEEQLYQELSLLTVELHFLLYLRLLGRRWAYLIPTMRMALSTEEELRLVFDLQDFQGRRSE